MPVLSNAKHELFAQEVAKGKSIDDAFRRAGYKFAHKNAKRLRENEAVSERIDELLSQTAQKTSQRAQEDERQRPKPEQDTVTGRFVSGNIGGGRPKGSRNKLGEAFVSDLYADWQEHGTKTIERVRDERPQDYLKVIASILPKDVNLNVSALDEMSDDELLSTLATVRALAAQLHGAGIEALGDETFGGDGDPPQTKPH